MLMFSTPDSSLAAAVGSTELLTVGMGNTILRALSWAPLLEALDASRSEVAFIVSHIETVYGRIFKNFPNAF